MRYLIATIALGVAGLAGAQEGLRLSPGDLLYYSDTERWKVLNCRQRPEVSWRECEMKLLLADGSPSATPASWQDEQMVAKGDARIRRLTGKPPRAGTEGAGRCVATRHGGTISGNRPASAALFRQKIADLYAFRNSDRMTVGVQFEQFRVGAPIRNVVRLVPGVGARRLNDGAPVDAMMYPVASTYTVCEAYPGSGGRSRYINTHYCFVDRDDGWACGGGGGPPPRITRVETW